MSDLAENPRASIGGNNPPSLEELLAEKAASLVAEMNKIGVEAKGAPEVVKTEDDLDKVGNIIVRANKVVRSLEEMRKFEKQPFLDGGRTVDGFFKTHLDKLAKTISILDRRANVYTQEKLAAERRRREAEAEALRQEEQRRREAAARAEEEGRARHAALHADKADRAAERLEEAEGAALQTNADIVRTRTDSGVAVGARTTWRGEITNIAEVDLEALRPYLLRADIEKAINTAVRVGVRDLKGVRIFEDVKTTFR